MTPPNESAVMSFGDHLDDLRRRLVLVLVAVIPVFVVALFFGKPLIGFLAQPAFDALTAAGLPDTLLATSPLDPFLAYMKVALIAALLLGTPWILLQVWLFVAPGLYAAERRFIYFLLPLSVLLTAAGMVFLYKVLLPVSLTFLVAFNASLIDRSIPRAALPEDITLPTMPVLEASPTESDFDEGRALAGSMWLDGRTNQVRVMGEGGEVLTAPLYAATGMSQEFRVGEYMSLVFLLAIVFAISSQLPIAMLLSRWAGIFEPESFTPYRRYIFFGCAIVGAILTPADPFSMIALGGALYVLFEFGLVLMKYVPASLIAGPASRGTDGDLEA